MEVSLTEPPLSRLAPERAAFRPPAALTREGKRMEPLGRTFTLGIAWAHEYEQGNESLPLRLT